MGQAEAVRNEVLPVLDEPVRLGAGDDDRAEGDRGEAGGDVEVGGRRRPAVQHFPQERLLGRVEHVVVDEPEKLEHGNQPDPIRHQDEHEERQDQRGPRVDPLAADVRQHDRVADVLDEGLQAVREADGNLAILPEIPADRNGHDHEDQRGDQPQHEDVLRDGEIDAEDRRQVNQRMVDPAVRDVLDDDLAGVEGLGRRLRPAVGLGLLLAVLLQEGEHRGDHARASPASRRRSENACIVYSTMKALVNATTNGIGRTGSILSTNAT